MATVPRMRDAYPSSPPLPAWASPSNTHDAADEELRAQVIDTLGAYSSGQDATQLVAILDRVREMCDRDLQQGGRTAGAAQPQVDHADLAPLSRVVKNHVLEVYKTLGSNKTRAARVLEIDIKTLYNKLKRYGVQ